MTMCKSNENNLGNWEKKKLKEEIIVIFKYLESAHVEEETLALIEPFLVYVLGIYSMLTHTLSFLKTYFIDYAIIVFLVFLSLSPST